MTVARKRKAPASGRKPAAPNLTLMRIAHALERLAVAKTLKGTRSHKLSARIDPGLIAAARRRTGITNDSELVTAALAMVAGDDDFGPWLVSQPQRLPDDFESGL